MKRIAFLFGFIVLFLMHVAMVANGKVIYNKHFKFKITIPETLIAIADTEKMTQNQVYFDTLASIVMLISNTESKFNSVQDYIDCSRLQLEKELQNCYSDSTLKVVSCNKPPYYPKETVLLYIEVGVLPSGYDQSIIYFIHHKAKDLQFSFMLKKCNAEESLKRINEIMKTLKLL